jgi:uncharacterized protein
MNLSSQSRTLTDDEIARLDDLLGAIEPDESMVAEELDGFFAALACCPEPVAQSEWLPVVLGRENDAAVGALEAHADGRLVLRLLERHRQAVAAALYDGQGFAPVLAFDEAGVARGNAWAIGFVRGMALRPDAWSPLDEDDEYADALEPVMQLVDEAQSGQDAQDEPSAAAQTRAPAQASPPVQAADASRIDPDEREALIHDMLDGVQDVYEFFRESRERRLAPAEPIRRAAAKVGRNDPCPCGSGRKYKSCCGASPG